VKLAAGINEEIYRKLKNHITTFSYDLNINRYGEERINLNNASFETIFKVLKNLGYEDKVAGQIADNIVAYRSENRDPPQYQVEENNCSG
jgi:DNA uptake protein ComE-like DNA-binding protein